MEKIKMLSLFSGIGAFEKALQRIGIQYELLNYCEIDKYASKSYCAIHNETEEKNLWDITKVDISKLPKNIDLITHGSPCQDFSIAGKGSGGDVGSDTRSSLLWNSVEIIKYCKPKVVFWENVKNVLSKKHKHNFEKYLSELEKIGYKNSYRVLNAKDFGIPQNRERIFVVSCLDEEIDLEKIVLKDCNKILKDFLQENVDDKYYLNDNKKMLYVDKYNECKEKINLVPEIKIKRCFGLCDRPNREKADRYSFFNPLGISPTLHTCGGGGTHLHIIINENYGRRLTPKEYFRLMGFDDEDLDRCKHIGISDSQLYKQAGNSIVVNVLEEIFKTIFHTVDL